MNSPAGDINIGKWAADFAQEFIKKNINDIYSSGKKVLKGAKDETLVHFKSIYTNYLTCVTERNSKTKSFLIRNEPTNIYKFYVDLNLSSDYEKIRKATINRITDYSHFNVLKGMAGSGKSMLMKHLFIDTVIQQKKVPIFVELRDLNDSDISIFELITESLTINKFDFDKEFIIKTFKAGHFAVFLDGFDETINIKRQKIVKEIDELINTYDKNYFIISSRPDSEYGIWKNFQIWDIDPLNLEQACELVDKLPGDAVKSRFITELKKSLFEEHKSFLSNPLTLSIMLLTYQDNASIPKKMSSFYQQAYDTLFHRHDALKGGYIRERLSKLESVDFASVFSAFSIQTYDKRAFKFTRSEVLSYLKNAQKLTNINFYEENYLKDVTQGTSLLIDDGTIEFAHRSFQEYFAACFINNSRPDIREKLVHRYAKNIDSDSVIAMLFDLNPELVEKVLIIPTLKKLYRFPDTDDSKKVSYEFSFCLIETLFEFKTTSSDGSGEFGGSPTYSTELKINATKYAFISLILKKYKGIDIKDILGNIGNLNYQFNYLNFKEIFLESPKYKLKDILTTNNLDEINSLFNYEKGFINIELLMQIDSELFKKEKGLYELMRNINPIYLEIMTSNQNKIASLNEILNLEIKF